jgi:hypothetical protein
MVATRRALSALADEGYVERLEDTREAYWALRESGIGRSPADRTFRLDRGTGQTQIFSLAHVTPNPQRCPTATAVANLDGHSH